MKDNVGYVHAFVKALSEGKNQLNVFKKSHPLQNQISESLCAKLIDVVIRIIVPNYWKEDNELDKDIILTLENLFNIDSISEIWEYLASLESQEKYHWKSLKTLKSLHNLTNLIISGRESLLWMKRKDDGNTFLHHIIDEDCVAATILTCNLLPDEMKFSINYITNNSGYTVLNYAANKNGIILGNIIRKPVENLVDYHLKQLQLI